MSAWYAGPSRRSKSFGAVLAAVPAVAEDVALLVDADPFPLPLFLLLPEGRPLLVLLMIDALPPPPLLLSASLAAPALPSLVDLSRGRLPLCGAVDKPPLLMP